jgi:vanillate O-demethylase monooxygenase subunit
MRNAAVGNDDASKQIDDLFRIAFEEDKEILEAIHKEEQRQQTRAPIRIAIDRAPLVYRKRIKELVNLGSQQR